MVADIEGGLFPQRVVAALSRGDQRGGTHTNERSHVKLITISSNGLYDRQERSDLNPSTSI